MSARQATTCPSCGHSKTRRTQRCYRCSPKGRGPIIPGEIAEAMPENSSYRGMKERCYNPNHFAYHRYGGRGIAVCERWRASFVAFLQDMGRKPTPKHCIERIDNNRGYDCGWCDDCKSRGATANCRWAEHKDNCQNTVRTSLIECFGKRLTLSQWAARTGLPKACIRGRLRLGWSALNALTTPQLRPFRGRRGGATRRSP